MTSAYWDWLMEHVKKISADLSWNVLENIVYFTYILKYELMLHFVYKSRFHVQYDTYCVSREHYLPQVQAIKLNSEYLFQPKKTKQTYLCPEVENLPPILTQISTLSDSAIIHITEKK